MVDACRMYGREINVYNILVGKPEEIRPLGQCRYEWKDNIKMGLKEYDMSVWSGFRIRSSEWFL
jgi:hypothetical protein